MLMNMSGEKTDDEAVQSETNNLDLIVSNLWLGNLSAATDLETINSRNITSILTVNSFPLPPDINSHENLKIKYIEAQDTPTHDLISHFNEAHEFLEDSLKNGAVLVHCYSGVSRSAAIVISYLMKNNNWSLEQAYQHTKTKRKAISPNYGFMEQLKLFQRMSCKIDRNNVLYKMFQLSLLSNSMKKIGMVPSTVDQVISTDPKIILPVPDAGSFKCRKCRRILAYSFNIIPHMVGAECSWKSDITSVNVEHSALSLCKKMYYIEPLQWMKDIHHLFEGKLHCPNTHCKQKLGFFNWISGCQCPCGTTVIPSFSLTPSKIDVG